MDIREKLVEILADAGMGKTERNYLADKLIANGVTVHEWISVNENPKWKGCYIVVVNHWVDGKPVAREAYWNGCDWLSCDKKLKLTPRVTHWMQLPQPPKGE